MRIIVCENYDEMSKEAAKLIEGLVTLKPNCILGLATGSTPVGMYKILSEKCKKGELDFSSVKSYNLDEYYPISPDNDQSYRYFMNDNLFNHINIDKENTFVPNGQAEDIEKECKEYDEMIEKMGGADIQVLGIGNNGHIAFNEPDAELVAGTHVTGLTESTIQANSRFFASIDDVPTKAVTMGMASIMKAKKIMLLASGKGKHEVVKKLLDDKITTSNPATLLKLHKDVVIICDKEAYEG